MGSVSTIYNGVRTWLAGRALMDVAFSDRSTNGVQNKVIKAKFDEVDEDITQLNSDLADLNTKVSITTVDGDTYATALGKLKAAVNWSKVTEKSTLHTYGSGKPTAGDVYVCNDQRGVFSNAHSADSSFECYTINMINTNTSVTKWTVNTNGATRTSLNSTVIGANFIFEIWY